MKKMYPIWKTRGRYRKEVIKRGYNKFFTIKETTRMKLLLYQSKRSNLGNT
jgi:hypothetical protein